MPINQQVPRQYLPYTTHLIFIKLKTKVSKAAQFKKSKYIFFKFLCRSIFTPIFYNHDDSPESFTW